MKFKYHCLPIVLLLSGCAAKTGHQFLEDMSEAQVASSLVSNVTTKAQLKAEPTMNGSESQPLSKTK